MIKLREDKHIYEDPNGNLIPSVSEITECMSKLIYGGDVDQSVLEAAADRGTRVHKATEAIDHAGAAMVDGDIGDYVGAYVKFKKEHEIVWEKIEEPIWNRDRNYAGTLDRYGVVDGVKTLLDIKTTGSIGKKQKAIYTAAQNLYRMAMHEEIEQILILQLKSDGSYKLHKLPLDTTLSEACLAIHEALTTRRKKKHG